MVQRNELLRTNSAGRSIIKAAEGKRLTAYLCPAGKWTIGWGSTSGVKRGMVITEHEAELRFAADVENAESDVCALVTVPLNENQLSALVSFVFNFGAEKLRTSTLLKKLNAGDYAGAAKEFPRWKYSYIPKLKKSVPLDGLVKRRKAEMEVFLSE